MSKKTKVVITIEDGDNGRATAEFKFFPPALHEELLTPSQSMAVAILGFLNDKNRGVE